MFGSSDKNNYLPIKVLIYLTLAFGGIFSSLIFSRALAQTSNSAVSSNQCTETDINASISRLETVDPTAFDFLVACDQTSVRPLIKFIQNGDEDDRIVAITILGEIGSGAIESIPLLETILNDSQYANKDIRQIIHHEQNEDTDTAQFAINSLIRNENIKDVTIDALESMGQPAVHSLVSALVADVEYYNGEYIYDFTYRSKIITSLTRIGKPAVPALIAALEFVHEDFSLRRDLTFTLTKIGKPAIPDLIAALEHENVWLQFSAAIALGRMRAKAKDALPILIPKLRNENVWIRASAAEALGQIGIETEDTVSTLIDIAREDICFEPRFTAIYSLDNIIDSNQANHFYDQLRHVPKCTTNYSYYSSYFPDVGEERIDYLAEAMEKSIKNNPPAMCSYPVIKTVLSWKCP